MWLQWKLVELTLYKTILKPTTITKDIEKKKNIKGHQLESVNVH